MIFDSYGQKALELIDKGENLFITGKAGTGKTTLLKAIVTQLKQKNKCVAVTAPTGVAAHNAEGVTLHSLLHIPLCAYIPGIKIPHLYSLNKFDIEVIKSLDTIIIDEVSMVRCDLMDAIDDILRHYRGNGKPFGGVQLILIGDLYQLMPVITDEDKELLEPYYKESYYFFNSKVMEKFDYSVIELQTIYRQDKRSFIRLLNKIRRGKLTDRGQKKLDSIYAPRYKGYNNDKQIILTTHNWMAKSQNYKKLSWLDGEVFESMASSYDWPEYIDYPANYNLKLKIGARVMFIYNKKGSYYNGMLGTVEDISIDCITIRSDDGDRLIDVFKNKWTYEKYRLNKKTKELEIMHVGSFVQFPLKLAWAITIHKSQGLTFDNVVIDAGKAFAPGQVYVALSRCRTFENIVLLSRITPDVVKIDPVIADYLRRKKPIEIEEPIEQKTKTQNSDESPVKINEKKNIINRKKATKLPKTIRLTLELFEKGNTPEQIAIQRKLSLGTIIDHLSSLVSIGKISIYDILDAAKIEKIEKAIRIVKTDKMTPIKEQCSDEISYYDIKLFLCYHRSIVELLKNTKE